MEDNNIEYIKEFIKKHNYSPKITIQVVGEQLDENIVSVKFNKKDVKLDRTFKIDEIRYDIDTDLPDDVFFRYLEYLEKNEDDVDYIYWMTKMSNGYEPMDIDFSSRDQLLDEINQSLAYIKKVIQK
jgi:hypothetical protein